MLSTTTVIGRVAKDPELKETPSGVPVVNFTVACERSFKDADGTRRVDWYDCVAWRKTASFVAEFFHKGDPISVLGRMEQRSYENAEGRTIRTWELQVREADFVPGRPRGSEGATAGEPEHDESNDDIPF